MPFHARCQRPRKKNRPASAPFRRPLPLPLEFQRLAGFAPEPWKPEDCAHHAYAGLPVTRNARTELSSRAISTPSRRKKSSRSFSVRSAGFELETFPACSIFPVFTPHICLAIYRAATSSLTIAAPRHYSPFSLCRRKNCSSKWPQNNWSSSASSTATGVRSLATIRIATVRTSFPPCATSCI